MTDILTARLENLRLEILRTHDKKAGESEGSTRRRKIDALLVSDIHNVRYLSGFTGSAAQVLVLPEKAYLITDSRYAIQAREQCPHLDVRVSKLSTDAGEQLASLLAEQKKSLRIGFETSASYRQVETWQKYGARWRPVDGIVERLRMVKDSGEVDAIRNAARIAAKAFNDASRLLVPGTSERDVAIAIETAMRRRGAEGASFPTIVASGPNGALPHHSAGARKFEPGDLVTIDWGAEVNGYCSDLTRTVLIPGAPATDKQRDVYRIVLEAKERATAAIRPGVTGSEIDAIAREHITAHGYGEAFGHSLGHSIGRVVHDGATLSPKAAGVVLRPGVVTTVEPGIYLEGWGGVRIEDDVLVTETGHELLSEPAGPLDAPRAAPPRKRASAPKG
ncbi:MAG: Xaa-Pro peptidase family protein [Capsulimonadaceae bacterium]|nr:Xaa-Pro peptidase family protein [Capsulimonadaceae bacterium]